MLTLRRLLLTVLTLTLILGSGCSSRSGFGDSGNCDYLIFAQIGESESLPVQTFACSPDFVGLDMNVVVVLRSPGGEDGGVGEPPDPTDLSRFFLSHYDVTYRNLNTGGTVQGVDVPFSFRQSVSSIFDMAEEEELELTGFPILQAGAKSSPPLNDDAFYPQGRAVEFEVTITYWGHPVTDSNAWCYAVMRWNVSVVPC